MSAQIRIIQVLPLTRSASSTTRNYNILTYLLQITIHSPDTQTNQIRQMYQ